MHLVRQHPRQKLIPRHWVIGFFISFCFCVQVSAQAPGGQAANENFSLFAFTVGPTLPNKIAGVPDIMPTGAFSFGTHLGGVLAEFAFHLVNTFGYELYNPSASLRMDIPMDSLVGIVMVGIDDTYYHGPDQSFTNVMGAHLGGGILAGLSENVFVRGDMKFNMNPGTSLYIGIGLEFHWGGGGGGGT